MPDTFPYQPLFDFFRQEETQWSGKGLRRGECATTRKTQRKPGKEMIGKNLRYLRKTCSTTQPKFAAMFDIPVKTYQAYEYGRANPSIDTLRQIAEHFGTDIDTLCTQDLSAKRHPKPSQNDKILSAYRSLQPKERKAVDVLLFG